MKFLLSVMLLLGCGTEHTNTRTKKYNNTALDKLKVEVLELQGTVSQINAFVANDFSNCSSGLPAFETKICQIAQTATAEQQVIFTGQLQHITKIFQDKIFGEDCINETDAGCPVTGSILADIADIDVSGLESDITQIQADVLQVQADITSLNSRLDDFDGTGDSIETVIVNIEADITALESRIDVIEDIINNGDIYRTHFICGDVSNSGPIFEPMLITGNDLFVYGYVNTTTKNGLGVIAEAGVSGDQFLKTESNTKDCNFKIYDLTSSLKLCWDNSDKKATTGEIDTACDSANSFATPTSDCTCVN